MTELFAFLIEPFLLPFMMRALVVMVCLGVAASVVGAMVSVRGAEFAASGFTHAAFPGMAVGFIVSGSDGVFVGALVAALIAVVAMTLVAHTAGRGDAGIAIVFTALFGIGVIVVSAGRNFSAGLEALLFGRLLAVTDSVFVQAVILCAVVTLTAILTFKETVMRAFDETHARSLGYRVAALDVLTNALVAAVVVVASATIGNLLALAVIIAPVAFARLVTSRLGAVVVVACATCVGGAWLGLGISYATSVHGGIDLPPSAVIVSILAVPYVLALTARLLWGMGRRLPLGGRVPGWRWLWGSSLTGARKTSS